MVDVSSLSAALALSLRERPAWGHWGIRAIGALAHWRIGTLGHWGIGGIVALAQWRIGALGALEALGHWEIGALALRALVHWH